MRSLNKANEQWPDSTSREVAAQRRCATSRLLRCTTAKGLPRCSIVGGTRTLNKSVRYCSASSTWFEGLRAERSRAHTFGVGRFEQ